MTTSQEAKAGELAIPESDWLWRGMQGHLIVSAMCCFHLHTEIGSHRIGTIGCYHPQGNGEGPRKTVGIGRLYETMVFKLGTNGEVVDWSELDGEGYNEERDAQLGHVAMCHKWAVPR